MLVKPHLIIKFLHYNSSRHISSPNHVLFKLGLSKSLSPRANCPLYKIRFFSTAKVYFNANSEGDISSNQNQTISNSAVDALKTAVSKACVVSSFEGKTSGNIINQNKSSLIAGEKFRGPHLKKGAENTKDFYKIMNDTAKKTVKKKVRVDLTVASTERNFITPARAISDFLLKPQDLESLKAIKRRSPYENDPPMTVYWRKDVEAKAIEVWGTKENLQKELLKRDLERKFHQQYLFANKKRLKDYRKVRNSQTEIALNKTSGLFGSSGKVVLTAVAMKFLKNKAIIKQVEKNFKKLRNASNFIFKLAAWVYSGSHSMFSEAIHSLADTINQLILAYGIHKSVQVADEEHPYGYSNMKYVSSLISGVGIFCVGTGLSIYHGITGLYNPAPAESFFWAFCILGGSLVSEGATLLVAINSIKKGAAEKGMTFREYVFRGQEPSVNVVLLEDLAAVLGVSVAAICMGLTSITGSHVPDALGSLIIGGLLGCVASFIIYTNVAALVGRSISHEFLEKINSELESDVMIRAIHDVKGIDMGNCLVRYKAELDFDGRELAKAYLDTQNIHALLEEVQQFKTIDELESFILKHSESIIDKMGAEIDRIEMKLRTKFPEIRHCDLEIL